jgi:Ca2+:H+ antiporter
MSTAPPSYGAVEGVSPAEDRGDVNRSQSFERRQAGVKFTRSTVTAARFCKRLERLSSNRKEKAAEDAAAAAVAAAGVSAPSPQPPAAAAAADPGPPRTWSDVSNDVAGLRALVSSSAPLMVLLFLSSALAVTAVAFRWGPVSEFALSFVALLPLAMLLGDLTEGLAAWCGPVAGGLMNATLGNATEAIILVQAVRHGLVEVEQAALLGGVLSNLLLVIGLCFAFSKAQKFNNQIALADMGVLFIGAVAIVLPTLGASTGSAPAAVIQADALRDSRATAFILLAMYGAVLTYTLAPPPAKPKSATEAAEKQPLLDAAMESGGGGEGHGEGDEEEGGTPDLSMWTLLALLTGITVAMAFLSDALVVNVFPVAHKTGVSASMISVLFLPVIGNAAELATAVMAARRGHMDLAHAVALGSAIQIGLFLLPVAVLFGWAIDVPMSLDFAWPLAAAFFVSVIIGSILLLDGRSNWLKGSLLLGLYVIFILSLYENPTAAVQGPAPAPAPAARN